MLRDIEKIKKSYGSTGDESTVAFLIEHGADITATDRDGNMAFVEAAPNAWRQAPEPQLYRS